MERKIVNGDYIPDGAGGLKTLGGAEEVLARVLFRLTARRGALPFLPHLGSRLYQLTRERPSLWQGLAERYVREALEEETELQVSGVEVNRKEHGAELTVQLNWQGEALSVSLDL